jgi:hypothetical protein
VAKLFSNKIIGYKNRLFFFFSGNKENLNLQKLLNSDELQNPKIKKRLTKA